MAEQVYLSSAGQTKINLLGDHHFAVALTFKPLYNTPDDEESLVN
jgi:hypothetical protein